MKPTHKVVLVILDGWGIRKEREANAIALAGTPNLDSLAHDFPLTELHTSGLAVGLPEGQMGNSEVGHTNIGAGRIVYQDLVRINRACESGELGKNPVIHDAMEKAKREGTRFHLLGLVSPGGVHSSMDHLFCLLETARALGLPNVFVHAFLDGRDTPPQSALGQVQSLQTFLTERNAGRIATVSGRYYAMDRDKRWDRVQRAFDAMVRGEGPKFSSADEVIRASYAEKVTDEFVLPSVIHDANGPIGSIRDGDVVVFFNFRADRARELTSAIAYPQFEEFPRGPLRVGRYVCMTQYDERFVDLPVAFGPDQPDHIFPEILAQHSLRQFRTAETEKYAHVTFFFNGGREVVFPGEDRNLVPSPRDVKTYDLKPEMSAREVTDELCRRIESNTYDFALVNYANPDMVGHSGVLSAGIQAARVVDECIGRVWRSCQKAGYVLAVTADHGNLEQMVDPQTGQPHTAHTLFPVPFHLAHPDFRGLKLRPGVLADISPTLLKVMGLPQPEQMNRQSLF